MHSKHGFSLLELSIVLLIVALIAGSSIVAGIVQTDSARTKQTYTKMAAIEKAMMVFRKNNDRLPCPSSPTIPQNNILFGREYPASGECAGARMYGDFIVEGAVPVRALNLPDEFVYDGWGQRFTYSINRLITAENAFTATSIEEECGGINIQDESGTDITTEALYILLSHGKNGHGGYNSQGTRISSNSSNVKEFINCDCDGNAAYTNVTPRAFVQKSVFENTVTVADNFDDVLTYKSRWQMALETEKIENKRWPEQKVAMVGLYNAPLPVQRVFTRSCDRFTALPALQQPPLPAPSPTLNSAVFSKDATYLAINYPSENYIKLFRRNPSDNSYVQINNSLLTSMTAINTNHIAMDPDAKYIVNAHNNLAGPNRNITIYRRNGDTLTALPPIASGNLADSTQVAISDDGTYIASAQNGGSLISIYKSSGNSFIRLGVGAPDNAPDIVPIATAATSVAFSHDSNYLAVGYNQGPFISLYQRNGDQFLKLPDLVPPPPATVVGLSFYNATYLAMGSNSANAINVYKRIGSNFTKLTLPPTPVMNPTSVAFSRYGTYLAVANNAAGSPRQALYRRSGDSFVSIYDEATNPQGAPAGLNSNGFAFVP